MRRRLAALWLSASLPRALLEATGVSLLLSTLLLAAVAIVPAPSGRLLVLGLNLPAIGLVGGAIGATRLRPDAQSSPRSRWRERGAIAALSLALTLVMLGTVGIAALLAPADPITAPTSVGAAVAISLLLAVSALLRAAALAWERWNQLRQTRLLWALTHAQLMFSFLFAVSGAALVVPGFLFGADLGAAVSPGTPPLAATVVRLTVRGLPVAGGFLVLIILGTALSAPLVVLTSRLFIRPIVQRLEALAAATSALRRGQLATRVPVSGRDELAALQADFNAMASDLQGTMDALRRERDAVKLLLQRRRELVAAVSHELRTPVATLRSYLDASLKDWEEAPPTLRADLAVMEREVVRLSQLLDDLFTLARAEAGGLPLDRRATDVGALLARSAAATAPAAWERRRVEVLAEPPAAPVCALADAGRLEQAVRNLIANGVRHTPPGGVVLLTASASPAGVTVQVRDTGEGIAEVDLPHLFERFYRGEGAQAHEPTGAGLGLAIVKELVEAMDGSVEVTSAPGEGSSFTLHLPAALCDNLETLL